MMFKFVMTLKRFLLICLIIICTFSTAHAKMVSISKRKVNMRSGPGKKYAVLWELGKGYPLKVVTKNGSWIKVTDFEGDIGWIHKNLLSNVPHLIVKKDRVNLRSGPGKNYRIKGKANYGVVLRTIKRVRGWVQVEHEDGLRGWVKRNLVWGW